MLLLIYFDNTGAGVTPDRTGTDLSHDLIWLELERSAAHGVSRHVELPYAQCTTH